MLQSLIFSRIIMLNLYCSDCINQLGFKCDNHQPWEHSNYNSIWQSTVSFRKDSKQFQSQNGNY